MRAKFVTKVKVCCNPQTKMKQEESEGPVTVNKRVTERERVGAVGLTHLFYFTVVEKKLAQ